MPAAALLLGPPRLMLDARSWPKLGSGLDVSGDPEAGEATESPMEPMDRVLSEGA